jgi:serine/threonine protein kinase
MPETQTTAGAGTHHVNYIDLVLNGRYKIVRELGTGGFATVYEAHDQTLLSKRVVVKVLHSAKIDPWLLRKFRQEKEALARIDHPGVVAVLDEGTTPEATPFLVMQYVDGGTLRSLVEQGPMEFNRASGIIRQIGLALEAAHNEGVYHRDLKPENIMLQSSAGEDRVRLIDFGIAGIADSVFGSAGQSTRIAGTIRYMPPEQMTGEVSPQSDIYAFGAVAFELLTGKPAVDSPMQLVSMPPGALEQKLRDLRGDLPEAAGKMLLKALSADPTQRQASAREMGDRLAESLRPAVVTTVAPGQPGNLAQRSGDQLEVAHVLFLDIVRYSTLSMEDQRKLLQTLQDVVRQSPHFLEAEKNRDVIALPAGDGMALVFFGDPTSAADCALEIARAIREHLALKLRMGLHSGPVYRVNDINKNLNVSGGGINLAQRVMDAGDAGHILLSSGMADVLAQIGGWKGWLTDLGEHQVKHGVAIRFYNLSTGEAGNTAWPSKWEKPPDKGATRRWALGALALPVLGGGGWVVYQKLKPPPPEPPKPPPIKLELSYFIDVVTALKDGNPVGAPYRLAQEVLFQKGNAIAVNLSFPVSGYLYILNDGPLPDGTQSIIVLYPALNAPALIDALKAIRIPEKGWLQVDEARGTEKFYLAWSHDPVPEFERAKNQADAVIEGNVVIRAQDQLAALRQLLERYSIPGSRIRTDADAKTTFLTSDKDILVHLIRLQHL